MLRISCSCGKFLKIDDKLLGKKIKCPACGAAQVVKAAPETAVCADPKAPPAAPAGVGPLPAPAKHSKPTKRSTPWLLIGSSVAAVLVVASIATGVWFATSGQEKPKPAPIVVVAKTVKETPPEDKTEALPAVEPSTVPEQKKDVVPPPSPKPAALVLRLKNVKAAWVDGQSAINLTADYAITGDGKPNPQADYILHLKLADGQGGKQAYRVQALAGVDLVTGGKLANPRVVVAMPPKSLASVCDVVFVEKVSSRPEDVVIDSQENVFVSGTPPSPTPATVAVDLSNAKVERLPNKKTRFTVDYKFTSGQADASKTYRLLAGMYAGKTAQPQAKPFEGKGNQLDTEGTLTYDIPFDATASTKFELWLTEAAGINSKATVVSNKLEGKVTAKATEATVQFQITQARATKTKGQKNKVPAQQFTLQFQWKLTSGQLNPQATYQCVAMVPGAAEPLVTAQGLQFQANGQYSVTRQYSGQTNFSIYIIEVLPDQPPRTVSNVQNVNVR